jgi:hypothetical protein
MSQVETRALQLILRSTESFNTLNEVRLFQAPLASVIELIAEDFFEDLDTLLGEVNLGQIDGFIYTARRLRLRLS